MARFSSSSVQTPPRANSDIARDFLDLAFKLESGRELDRLTRFEGPISVRITGNSPATLLTDLQALTARLQREAQIDIFLTQSPQASITVETVPRSALQQVVPGAACFVAPGVTSWQDFNRQRGTATTDWSRLTQRIQATVFIPNDAPPQEMRDCLHEEIAQALGPVNDLYRLSDSVFNDDNMHSVLTSFDMLILRAYYDPALQNGMSYGEVASRIGLVLSRINPGGDAIPTRPRADTSQSWTTQIELALRADTPPRQRAQAAHQATRIAATNGWGGSRTGLSYLLQGQALRTQDSAASEAAFRRALSTFNATPDTYVHAAHASVHLAAAQLRAGNSGAVIQLTDAAIPIARRHQNAALLATLMMLKAEAQDLQGAPDLARATRLDSLAWARYGFGSDDIVRARLRSIAALNPTHRS